MLHSENCLESRVGLLQRSGNNNINLFLLSRPSDERRSQYMKCQNVSLSYDETKMTCTGYPAAC